MCRWILLRCLGVRGEARGVEAALNAVTPGRVREGESIPPPEANCSVVAWWERTAAAAGIHGTDCLDCRAGLAPGPAAAAGEGLPSPLSCSQPNRSVALSARHARLSSFTAKGKESSSGWASGAAESSRMGARTGMPSIVEDWAAIEAVAAAGPAPGAGAGTALGETPLATEGAAVAAAGPLAAPCASSANRSASRMCTEVVAESATDEAEPTTLGTARAPREEQGGLGGGDSSVGAGAGAVVEADVDATDLRAEWSCNEPAALG